MSLEADEFVLSPAAAMLFASPIADRGENCAVYAGQHAQIETAVGEFV